jgi:hypothetical protein
VPNAVPHVPPCCCCLVENSFKHDRHHYSIETSSGDHPQHRARQTVL